MVSSLRRQNEDLRLKLSKLEKEQKNEKKSALSASGESTSDFKKLCQQESKELRTTIGNIHI